MDLSIRYLPERFLPDKAIDLLDEACSCAALRNKEMAEYDELNKKLLTSRQRVEELESDPEHLDYEQLAKIKADQLQMAARLDELEPGWFMKLQNGFFIPYLDYIQKDLDTRD